MDRSERCVLDYLESLDLGPVRYEPDGNIPPDFTLDGRIAVEVRRLNQNFETASGHEGLETVEAALARFVERTLALFGGPEDGRGWWVFFDFWRPVDLKAVKKRLPVALRAFLERPVAEGVRSLLTPGFELEIRPSGIVATGSYMLGGWFDRDAGGFVGSKILRNLNLCVTEKSAKIEAHRPRYAEWWLVLPDHIGPDLNRDERLSLLRDIRCGAFDRVVLLHPKDPNRALIALAGDHPVESLSP